MLVFKDPRPYKLDISKLRSSNNVPYVSSLFVELTRKSKFTLVLKEGKGNFPTFSLDSEFDLMYDANDSNPEHYYYSLRRLYLEHNDPNEYDFAKSIFGSWDHWLKLQENTRILNAINSWREELQTKLTSVGCFELLKKATEGDVNASKFIATKKWQDVFNKVKNKSDTFTESQELQEDYARLKLVSSQ